MACETTPVVGDLFHRAVALLRAGDAKSGEELLSRIIARDDAHADALHALAMLRYRGGHAAVAQAMMRQALARAPENVSLHVNLANMLFESGDAQGAIAAYREALARAPHLEQVWSNLATVAWRIGDVDQANQAWEHAVQLSPDDAAAWYGLATARVGADRLEDALRAYRRATALPQANCLMRERFILALVKFDRRGEGERLYREWLATDADDARSCLQLAATFTAQAPQRAADSYVEQLFEQFASSFDKRLALLDYKAPDLVAHALAARCPQGALDIADLGCGTGLCGPRVRALACQIVGCDLSNAMLDQARARGCYDALIRSDLEAFLHDRGATFDALVSADTLCYFGALDRVCSAAARSLRAKGYFVFTVEALEGDNEPWRLETTGRYRHSHRYVVDSLESAGFARVDVEPAILRLELGKPVKGWVVTALKP